MPMSRENLPDSKPLLIVLSGQSGVGKDAVLDGLRKSHHQLEFIVTNTTRAPRPNEREGTHYHFVSRDSFQELIDGDKLLEYAEVYGNWYGVPRQPVRRAFDEGKDVIVRVDVQGAATIKKIVPQAVFIFLAVPSLGELAERLKGRKTETPADLELRLETARKEMEQLSIFDYVVVNRPGEIKRAVEEVEAIITAEKCRIPPREISL